MRATFYLWVLTTAVLLAGLNWYFGMPLHVGNTYKASFIGSIDQAIKPQISFLFTESANFLDDRGIPSGNLRALPVYTVKHTLGVGDALINVWTSTSIAVIGAVLGVAGGVVILFSAVAHAEFLTALSGFLVILLAPIVFMLSPAAVLASLIYEESTTSYVSIVGTIAVLIWIPAVAVFYRGIGLARRVFSALWSDMLLARIARIAADRADRREIVLADEYAARFNEEGDAVGQSDEAGGVPENDFIQHVVGPGEAIDVSVEMETESAKALTEYFDDERDTAANSDETENVAAGEFAKHIHDTGESVAPPDEAAGAPELEFVEYPNDETAAPDGSEESENVAAGELTKHVDDAGESVDPPDETAGTPELELAEYPDEETIAPGGSEETQNVAGDSDVENTKDDKISIARSVVKRDMDGYEYTQYFDAAGNVIGRSEKKKKLRGRTFTHHDRRKP